MTESLELRLERLKHLGNVQLECLKRFYDRRSIVESYMDADVSLHVHHVVTGRPLCANYRVVSDHVDIVADRDPQLHASRAFYEDQVSVFVGVGEVAKPLRPLASVVRLQLLDLCDMRAVDALEPSLFPSPEVVWSIYDRKLCARLGFPAVENGERVDQIVESSTKVIDHLSDPDASIEQDDAICIGGNFDLHFAEVLRVWRVEFDTESVTLRVQKRRNSDFQILKMFACPLYTKEG